MVENNYLSSTLKKYLYKEIYIERWKRLYSEIQYLIYGVGIVILMPMGTEKVAGWAVR